MKQFSIYILMFFSMFILINCHCSKKMVMTTPVSTERPNTQKISAATPPALVYKTRKDYSRNVPVVMNEEKTRIVSYPAPTDIYFKGKLAYPTSLDNGYLLDNRGIGSNVAFLNYTYDSYSQLKEPLTMEQMMNSLLDKNPLLELWNCGPRIGFKDEIKEMNVLIEKGFPRCNLLVKGPKFK